ncbi:MAG TPA: COX15/CtaA family protein [Flavobacteriaceae bacterium]|nr:COX15/CtaA family protein [Flavobacteriaceae bacterium]
MYRQSVKIALILVYLVILAGAVVRMTGSGMGCPDWPKCFGHIIPPTERSELEWHPNQSFHKGQVIIIDETLQVAVSDFISGNRFQPQNWNLYTKHDYAKFNALHTWVEYINRLCGVLAGIGVFVMALLSFKKWRYKKRIVWLSWLSVFLMAFQGWLGATVVYSVLEPVKITVHMLMAIVIVAVLMYLLYISKEHRSQKIKARTFQNVLVVAILFTFIQIALGTQVRQFVDEQVDLVGYAARSQWLLTPDLLFYIHRSFSILILLVNLMLWWQNRSLKLGFSLMDPLLLILLLEIILGMAMYYFNFPFLSQPLHLLLAIAFFSIQFYIFLQSLQTKIRLKKA